MSKSSLIALAALGLLSGVLGYLAGVKPAAVGRLESKQPASPGMLGQRSVTELAPLPASSLAAIDLSLKEISEGNYAEAFGRLKSIEDKVAREEALLELIAKLDAGQLLTLAHSIIAAEEEEPFGNLFEIQGVGFGLVERLVELDPDGLLTIIEEMSGEGWTRDILFAVTSAFLAQHDPQRAIALNREKAEEGDSMLNDVVEIAIFGLAMKDTAAAVRLLREEIENFRVSEGEAADFDYSTLFSIGGSDLSSALAEVLTLPDGEGRVAMLESLFESWSAKDPQSAMIAAMQMEAGEERQEYLVGVIDQWTARDPAGARAYIEELADGLDRTNLAHGFVSSLAASDPEQAMRWAMEHLAGTQGMAAVANAAETIEPSAAIELLGNLSEDDRDSFLYSSDFQSGDHFLRRWAIEDPVRALRWVQENVAEGLLDRDPFLDEVGVTSSMGSEAAANDLNQAMLALDSLSGGSLRSRFLSGILQQQARVDPESAFAIAEGLNGEAQQAAQETIVESLGRHAPESAADYALSLGNRGLVRDAVDLWSADDPAAAYDWLREAHGSEAEVFADLLVESEVPTEWIRRDPELALRTVTPHMGDVTPDFVADAIETWTEFEPSRAAAFIDREYAEPGPVRDAAVRSLALGIRDSDPEAAARWAETIADESIRADVLQTMAEAR